MAGVSAAWSFDRFLMKGSRRLSRKSKASHCSSRRDTARKTGWNGEEVCHAAEDATVKFMHIEKGVDEVGGQGVYADNAEGKCPLGPFPFVPHINGQMKQGKKRQGNAGGSQDEGPRPHAFNDGVGAVQHPGGAERRRPAPAIAVQRRMGSRLSSKLSRYPSSHAQGGGGNDAERAFRVKTPHADGRGASACPPMS